MPGRCRDPKSLLRAPFAVINAKCFAGTQSGISAMAVRGLEIYRYDPQVRLRTVVDQTRVLTVVGERSAKGGAVCAGPWLRSGECVRGSRRSTGPLPPACAPNRLPDRSAS